MRVPREHRIAIGLIGLALAASLAVTVTGRADGAGGRPLRTLAAFDSRGVRLGPVLLPDPPLAWIALETPGPAVALRVRSTGVSSGTSFVVFELAGCVGTPLLLALPPGTPGLVYPFALSGIGPGNVVHIEDGPPTAPRPLGSFWNPGPPGDCVPASGAPEPTVPSRPLLVLDVTPPVRLGPDTGAARDPPQAVALLDATGARIGPVVGGILDSSVLRFPLVLPVRAADLPEPSLVFADRNRFQAGTTILFFATPDCSGPGLIPNTLSGQPRVFAATAIGPDGVLYRAEGEAAPITLASFWNSLGAPPSCDPIPAGTVVAARSTVPVVALAAFPGPFEPRLLTGGLHDGPASRGSRPLLTLADAHGHVLGLLFPSGLQGGSAVLAGIGGVGAVEVAEGRFLDGTNRAVYESLDCTGPPWIRPGVASIGLFLAAAVGADGLPYLQAGPEPVVLPLRSTFDPGPPPSCIPAAAEFMLGVLPASRGVPAEFEGPLSVR